MAKNPVRPDHNPFTCPRCGHKDKKFHALCPECGRPFFRDYPDTRIHPRDPDPTGVFKGKLWAWVFLVCTLLGLALYLLASFGII